MFTPHEPTIDQSPPHVWAAPAASSQVIDVESTEPARPRAPSRRRGLALAAVAIVAIGGGTLGGAIAGRHTPSAVTVSGSDKGFQTAAATSVSSQDVSSLIAQSLPSVVSISVEINGSPAAGSGFVISDDGQIATNAHVVADASSINVSFADGTSATGTVLGVDRTDDLAVVKVDKAGLKPLALGDSADLRMGEPAVAIGNALDLTGGPTATEGIVSALDRSIDTDDGEHLSHLVQTDAAINPGNSGGPLLTLDGKVVGINSAGSSDAQNIGFAIAVDTAKPIIDQLQQGKTVTKAYLGVTTEPIDASVAAQNGLDITHGLLVVDIAGGSAAETAGLKAGDIITAANGTTTNDEASFGDVISKTGAGNTLHLTVHRDGKDVTIDAKLSTHTA
jgi:S1-C subfamily serine protease